jgi:hypothetical protein
LQDRYEDVQEQEADDAWLPQREALEAQRAAVINDWSEKYPNSVATIVDLVMRTREVDAEVRRVNGARPRNCSSMPPLASVEREVPAVGLIMRDLVLPALDKGDLAYPPPRPSAAQLFAQQLVAQQLAGPLPRFDWRRDQEERAARQREENERMMADHADQAKEREARENEADREHENTMRAARGY